MKAVSARFRRDSCKSWRDKYPGINTVARSQQSQCNDLGSLEIWARCRQSRQDVCVFPNLDEISTRSCRDLERHTHHVEILTILARSRHSWRHVGTSPKFGETQTRQNLRNLGKISEYYTQRATLLSGTPKEPKISPIISL